MFVDETLLAEHYVPKDIVSAIVASTCVCAGRIQVPHVVCIVMWRPSYPHIEERQTTLAW